LVAGVGGATGSAGYQTALRLLIFFLLPAWGMSNAAATLVGQNLGAKQFERAEESVFKTMRYNVMYMAFVTILSLVASGYLAAFFTNNEGVRQVASAALRIMSAGYVFYGIAMVMMSAFNGAGDTWATTKLNFVGFWLFQVAVAYILSRTFSWGTTGVFVAIPIAYVFISLASYWLFKRGNWKKVKV
jgi:Na+-driven multidrug efflux pump